MPDINIIGKGKNTKLEESVSQAFNNEIYYAALLSALSQVCKCESYEDTSIKLEEMAQDKIKNAGKYILINGVIDEDILKGLNIILENEEKSVSLAESLINEAKDLGLKDIENIINKEIIEEKNHFNELKDLISKHDKKLSNYLLQRSRSDYKY